MKAHRAGSTVGVLAATGSEMWIDITKSTTSKSVTDSWSKRNKSVKSNDINDDGGPTSTSTSTHWMAESGILDLFIFLGPTPEIVFDQYTALTGKIPLPQLFAIAYHQCRWNYLSQDDVLDVQSKFDQADIPFDVIWLDIEYAQEHKYFIWDRSNFPEPEMMQDKLADRGRKVCNIFAPIFHLF
jgi:alpha 1,3-glucosidase